MQRWHITIEGVMQQIHTSHVIAALQEVYQQRNEMMVCHEHRYEHVRHQTHADGWISNTKKVLVLIMPTLCSNYSTNTVNDDFRYL